jgi:hypothetical protein
MKPEYSLEILNKVSKVKAPPYLFTRITGSIEYLEREFVSKKWVTVSLASVLLLMLLNISVITHSRSTRHKAGAEALIETLNLNFSNDIYHE